MSLNIFLVYLYKSLVRSACTALPAYNLLFGSSKLRICLYAYTIPSLQKTNQKKLLLLISRIQCGKSAMPLYAFGNSNNVCYLAHEYVWCSFTLSACCYSILPFYLPITKTAMKYVYAYDYMAPVVQSFNQNIPKSLQYTMRV